jgi:hypothetical protein
LRAYTAEDLWSAIDAALAALIEAGRIAGEEDAMKRIALTTFISGFMTVAAASAFAQTATCKSQSADKNLHGAAEKSFLTKCTNDAKTACDAQAADKKLAGAAKASFTKKCVNDAVGT